MLGGVAVLDGEVDHHAQRGVGRGQAVGQVVAQLVPENGDGAGGLQQGQQTAADLQEHGGGHHVDGSVLRASRLEDLDGLLHAQHPCGLAGGGPGVRGHSGGEHQGSGHEAALDPGDVGGGAALGDGDEVAEPNVGPHGRGGDGLAGEAHALDVQREGWVDLAGWVEFTL